MGLVVFGAGRAWPTHEQMPPPAIDRGGCGRGFGCGCRSGHDEPGQRPRASVTATDFRIPIVSQRSALPSREPLVERAQELRQVERAIAGAVAGNGWLLLVEGPAGIGRTALLAEARSYAGDARVLAIAGRGTELEQEFPYGVVRQALEPLVLATPEPGREQLLSGPAGLDAQTALGLKGGQAPAEAAFAAVNGLYWLVANFAAFGPLLLLIDDAHWADVPSLRFLAYLAQRLDGLAVSMIVSVRTGEPGPTEP